MSSFSRFSTDDDNVAVSRYDLTPYNRTLERITIWSGHLVFGIRCKWGCSVVVALPKFQITVQSKSGYALIIRGKKRRRKPFTNSMAKRRCYPE